MTRQNVKDHKEHKQSQPGWCEMKCPTPTQLSNGWCDSTRRVVEMSCRATVVKLRNELDALRIIEIKESSANTAGHEWPLPPLMRLQNIKDDRSRVVDNSHRAWAAAKAERVRNSSCAQVRVRARTQMHLMSGEGHEC